MIQSAKCPQASLDMRLEKKERFPYNMFHEIEEAKRDQIKKVSTGMG